MTIGVKKTDIRLALDETTIQRSRGYPPQPKIISRDTDRCRVTGHLDGGVVLEVVAHVPGNLEYPPTGARPFL
jgi:hypothetical protein